MKCSEEQIQEQKEFKNPFQLDEKRKKEQEPQQINNRELQLEQGKCCE